jgi:hypothetical protein
MATVSPAIPVPESAGPGGAVAGPEGGATGGAAEADGAEADGAAEAGADGEPAAPGAER